MRRLFALLPLALAVLWISSALPAAGAGSGTKLVVFFAQGWTSKTEARPFPAIQDVVAEVRKSRKLGESEILTAQYSYNYPLNAYTSCDTNRSLDELAQVMDHQLRDLMNQNPDAGFILIGHSLGGAIESYWAGKTADSSMGERILALVSLDSPIGGLELLESLGGAGEFLATLPWPLTCPNGAAQNFRADLLPDSEAVKAMHGAAGSLGQSRVFHWGSCRDLFVPCTTSRGEVPQLDQPGLNAGSLCLTEALLVLAFRNEIALAGAIQCVMQNHGAILSDPDVLSRIKRFLNWSLEPAHLPPHLEKPFTTPEPSGGMRAFTPEPAGPNPPAAPTQPPVAKTQPPAVATQPPAATQPPEKTQPPAATQPPVKTQPPAATRLPVQYSLAFELDADEYFPGEMIDFCYWLSPQGVPYRARLLNAGALVREWDDNGVNGGDCLEVPVNAEAQPGKRQLQLEAWIEGKRVAQATATLTIKARGVPPKAPSHLSIESGATMMWLGWRDNSDNEAGFEITDGDYLYTTPAGSVDFELDVGYGAYKCFQVRAVNQYGASEWTPFTCESTEAAPAQIQLGGLDDLDGYCKGKYGANADAQPSAGNWVCVVQGNVGAFYPINMDEACRWHYEASNVWARQTAAGNPYAWACYSGPR